MTDNGKATATVEVLAAEVHVLKVGSRQITLSVYRQLDRVKDTEIEPFGRVQDGQDRKEFEAQDIHNAVHVIGRHTETGALVRASRWFDPPRIWLDGLVKAPTLAGQVEVDGEMAVVYVRKTESTGNGYWNYASSEAKAKVEERVRRARLLTAQGHAARQEWLDLPLIVLAGLR